MISSCDAAQLSLLMQHRARLTDTISERGAVKDLANVRSYVCLADAGDLLRNITQAVVVTM
jgi:hypothetical protein